MINYAIVTYIEEYKGVNQVNAPDNHNLKKKITKQKSTNTAITGAWWEPPLDIKDRKLKVRYILKDFVPPPKIIKQGICMKKRKKFGYTKRFIILGNTQILMSRDVNF